MTHRHAQRRGVVPRPSDRHLAMLARLVKRAEMAAKAPLDAKKALILTQEAERVAKQAILPVGHQGDADSPLVRLIRMSKAWCGSTQREADAASLSHLAAHARLVVEAAQQGLANRSRLDVDG